MSNVSPEAAVGSLIGRDAELRHLTGLLGDCVRGNGGKRRLVTLCGCHGVGKSSLAVAAARQLTTAKTAVATAGPRVTWKGQAGEAELEPGVDGVTPMLVECRGCDGTFGSLTSRILAVFGLRHRQPYDTGSYDVIATCTLCPKNSDAQIQIFITTK